MNFDRIRGKNVLLAVLYALLVTFASVSGAAAVFAEGSGGDQTAACYVNDVDGVLTTDEDQALEKKASEISEKYNCGVYVLTISDSMQGSSDIFDYAEWFYNDYDLGLGEDRSGALLVVNPTSRVYATYFKGSTADYAFDSYGQEQLEDYFLPELRESNWQGALEGFVSGCGEFLQKAADGQPVRRSPAGRIAAGIAISCLISLIICLVLRSQMKSVHIGTSAAAFAVGGLHLTESRDRFTHRTRSERRIERESSGGSSSRSGSSGGSGRSGSF